MPLELSLVVHPTSGIPIYRQVVDQVRAHVVGGRLNGDAFLPSVRHLAESLQVNPMTISKAYSILEREGLLELVRGQGMRVKPAETNGRAKADVLLPLLKQVASTAKQLSLTPEQVLRQLKPLLEEPHDE